MKNINRIFLFSMILLMASCDVSKRITYFQDIQEYELASSSDEQPAPEIRLRPEDKISIIVTCRDPQLSAMFNLVSTTNRVGQTYAQSTGYGYVSYYTVDPSGEVDIPVLGKIHVAGLSRTEIAEKVKQRLVSSEQGVKDATVTVEYADLHVGVLGEVRNPGIVPIDRDRYTLLDALERAGDLTQYANRKHLKVFRKNGANIETYEVDMTQFKDVCSSPVFVLQQDDIIYAEPNKVKARTSTATGNTLLTPSFWMSVISVGISIAVLLKK